MPAPPTAGEYEAVRALTERLAAPLSAEDQMVQSMPDVSPTKWHRAHTTWFFEELVLTPHFPGYQPFHPAYRFLFNSYYDSVGPRYPRRDRGLISRPGANEVATYRRSVDAAMAELLARPPSGDAADLAELGLHHEQQHQELLLMDIKHVLSLNPLMPSYQTNGAPSTSGVAGSGDVAVDWVARDGGLVDIGHQGDGFAFDNESPRHSVYLQPFALASRPVSCGDWLAFIDDGGYLRPELWLSDGWAEVQAHAWDAPLYWRRAEEGDGSAWAVFTLHGERSVDPAEPVCHISYYEADAFARWAGARLPSEAEWEHGLGHAGSTTTTLTGADAYEQFAAGPLHPRAANRLTPKGLTPNGLAEDAMTGGPLDATVGQVWEWTASTYTPYPGFKPFEGTPGEYNGKFMVNQQVLRGSACVTPPGHSRPTYRNFFPPAARWPFTGARLARDL